MHHIAALVFKLMGWKFKSNQPNANKYIIAVVPHTSNRDFFVGILIATIMRVNTYFLIKKEMFFFPLGYILKLFKAIPVNRRAPKQMIVDVVERINESRSFVLVVTPEGTRSKVRNWKRGFYYIAKRAEIPILPAAVDYGKKEITFGDLMYPTDNDDNDYKALIDFYKSVEPKAKHPDKFEYPF